MSSPTTTVGSASAVLRAITTARLPGKATPPSHTPNGIPSAQAASVARSATRSDSAAIPNTSACGQVIRRAALEVEVVRQPERQREVVGHLFVRLRIRVEQRIRDRGPVDVRRVEELKRP